MPRIIYNGENYAITDEVVERVRVALDEAMAGPTILTVPASQDVPVTANGRNVGKTTLNEELVILLSPSTPFTLALSSD